MRYQLLFAMLWFSAVAVASPPTHDLDDKTALKIIQLQSRNTTPDVRIAMIQEGTSKQGAFEVAHARRVTTVEATVEKGAKVRRMACREFHWSDEYGWFTWESRMERGGEAVWIWSELKGEVVVR